MNDIVVSKSNLPESIGDLSKYVLIGREKLTAVRAEIRAIDKLGLAEEVRRQKLDEAQMISESVLDAESRIGALTAQMPKATNAGANQYQAQSTAVSKEQKPKSEAIKEIGLTQKQVERFEKIAKNPEIVEQAKAEARERDDVVSRSFVLQKIEEQSKPHVTNNSGNNEWYTPAEYIEAAREVMGSIDLDPASCEFANKTVKAKLFYTIGDDGLSKEWHGNVWMNPPYSGDLVGKFADKIVSENIAQAVVLVNNATETQWFNTLIGRASAVVFPKSRIRYYTSEGVMNTPLQGQAFIYIGENADAFLREFKPFGWGAAL